MRIIVFISQKLIRRILSILEKLTCSSRQTINGHTIEIKSVLFQFPDTGL